MNNIDNDNSADSPQSGTRKVEEWVEISKYFPRVYDEAKNLFSDSSFRSDADSVLRKAFEVLKPTRDFFVPSVRDGHTRGLYFSLLRQSAAFLKYRNERIEVADMFHKKLMGAFERYMGNLKEHISEELEVALEIQKNPPRYGNIMDVGAKFMGGKNDR